MLKIYLLQLMVRCAAELIFLIVHSLAVSNGEGKGLYDER